MIGMANPTYLKEPSDKIVMTSLAIFMAIGLSYGTWGVFSMAFGINKVDP